MSHHQGVFAFVHSHIYRSLYNWHPSEPGDQYPWNQDTIKEAAHRCLTKPPYNPACQNHGTVRVSLFFLQSGRKHIEFSFSCTAHSPMVENVVSIMISFQTTLSITWKPLL
jgi:hypothetical protein